MSHVFPRVLNRTLSTAVSAEGAWIVDADGRRYLDGAGGAIVVGVGHGDRDADRCRHRTAQRDPVRARHDVHDRGGRGIRGGARALLPMDDPRIYPVSGGSEAVETALKLARAYHLARGETSGRRSSPGGARITATRSARSTRAGRSRSASPTPRGSGGSSTRPPRTSTDAATRSTPTGAAPGTPSELERMISLAGADTVAAFIAEPVGGATLGGAVPPDDYWPAIVEVCRTARRAGDRRRGHDRVRPDRPVVRRGPLGCSRPTS